MKRPSAPTVRIRRIAAGHAARRECDIAHGAPIGPAVSGCEVIGITPVRETRPRVGFRPTTPLALRRGRVIDPSVSVPTAPAQSPAATATRNLKKSRMDWRIRRYGLRV